MATDTKFSDVLAEVFKSFCLQHGFTRKGTRLLKKISVDHSGSLFSVIKVEYT